MNLLVVAAIVGLIGSFLQTRSFRRARARSWQAWHDAARELALRMVEDDARGPSLRGRVGDVDFVVSRTQVRFGTFMHCATAEARGRVRRLVVHHRAFRWPSTVARSMRAHETGDAGFDREFEVRAPAPDLLPREARVALLQLPTPELTIVDGRIAIVWAIRGAPSEAELDAVRAILEALAAPERRAAYR